MATAIVAAVRDTASSQLTAWFARISPLTIGIPAAVPISTAVTLGALQVTCVCVCFFFMCCDKTSNSRAVRQQDGRTESQHTAGSTHTHPILCGQRRTTRNKPPSPHAVRINHGDPFFFLGQMSCPVGVYILLQHNSHQITSGRAGFVLLRRFTGASCRGSPAGATRWGTNCTRRRGETDHSWPPSRKSKQFLLQHPIR